MTQEQKKRQVVSYENMSEELAAAFAQRYPKGFNDYLPDLVKYTKPDGTPFYAVTIELPHAICLVKIKVKTDDVEEIERWLEGEDGAGDEGAGDIPNSASSGDDMMSDINDVEDEVSDSD